MVDVNDRVKETLGKIEEAFKQPDKLTGYMAASLIKSEEDRPIDRWSWGNRLLCLMHGTADARTFKQWKTVNRYVKKGEKAFFLLAPNTFRVKDEESDETHVVLRGFSTFAVFSVESTDGEPLPSYEPETLPPLMNVAESWGISVKYCPAYSKAHGSTNGTDRIRLMDHDESTFFHELVHCADDRCVGGLKGGQDPQQEAVAEIGAAVLARLYGLNTDSNAYHYVKSYTGNPVQSLLKLMPRIEKALNLILDSA